MPELYRTAAAGEAVRRAYRELLADWPVPNEQVSVPTAQGDTFVIVCGPETAPPLLLLHGSTANSATWMADIPRYAGLFRCYAIDMIGEAGLSAPVRPDLHSDAHAAWLEEVCSHFGLETVSIVSLSLGGWLALDFATRRPGRVKALAGIAPAGIGAQKNFLFKALPLLLLGEWGKRKMREMVLGAPNPNPTPLTRRIQALMTLILDSFRPRVVAIPVLSDEQIKALDFPILVIAGGRDVLLDSGQTRDRLQALAPDAEVLYLPEARHFIPETAGTILPFLLQANRLAPPGAEPDE